MILNSLFLYSASIYIIFFSKKLDLCPIPSKTISAELIEIANFFTKLFSIAQKYKIKRRTPAFAE